MEEEYKGQKATIASNTNAEDAPSSLFSHTHTNTLVVVDFAPLITHTLGHLTDNSSRVDDRQV